MPWANVGGAILVVAPSFLVRIGIAGIAGRVGRLLVEEVTRAGAELVGGVARHGIDAAAIAVPVFERIDDLARLAETVIDFTHADAASAHASVLADNGTAWVLGTTGLSDAAQAAVRLASSRVAVVQAANFSPGVALVARLAGIMAATLDGDEYDAEILEMHHRHKADAPSGTALALGRAVARARGAELAALRDGGRDGSTGPRRPGAIGFAALRGGEVVGEHTLSFTAGSEQIALTHRAFDRRVFAAGAVRAALWTAGRPPGLYGMEDVLGLS